MGRTLHQPLPDRGGNIVALRPLLDRRHIAPLFDPEPAPPYDHTLERPDRTAPVRLDRATAKYLEALLMANPDTAFPTAHTEALTNLRAALAT